MTGGQIRNIALCAAFLAVSSQGPVGMRHILEAAHGEYEKTSDPKRNRTRGGYDDAHCPYRLMKFSMVEGTAADLSEAS